MSARWPRSLALACFVCIFPDPALFAQRYDAIYSGTSGERPLIAVSIPRYSGQERLDETVAGIPRSASATVLVYLDYQSVSSTVPLAVYEKGRRTHLDSEPRRSTASPTIREVKTRSVRQGPRVGAICRDGWRSNATGRGACSHHGGVSRWLHASVQDPSAVMAAICSDYRLVAGNGKNCGPAQVLVRISSR